MVKVLPLAHGLLQALAVECSAVLGGLGQGGQVGVTSLQVLAGGRVYFLGYGVYEDPVAL